MAKVAKKAIRRRRERKNIERGAVHIQSTFNNTIVTITDAVSYTHLYGENKSKVITGLRRVSKPGLRIYTSCEDMPKVMRGQMRIRDSWNTIRTAAPTLLCFNMKMARSVTSLHQMA